MGKIRKLTENELVGGSNTTEIYPVTHVTAVYDSNGKTVEELFTDQSNKLKGRDSESKADEDPFIYGGYFEDWTNFRTELDNISKMCSQKYNGIIRYFLNGQRVDLVNRVLDYSTKRMSQTIIGAVNIDSSGALSYSGQKDSIYSRLYNNFTSSWTNWELENEEETKVVVLNNIESLVDNNTKEQILSVFSENTLSALSEKLKNAIVVDNKNGVYSALFFSTVGGGIYLFQNLNYSFLLRPTDNYYTQAVITPTNLTVTKYIYHTSLAIKDISNESAITEDNITEILNIMNAMEENKTIISSVGAIYPNITYKRPSYIIDLSYINGSNLIILRGVSPKNGGGSWSMTTIDLNSISTGESSINIVQETGSSSTDVMSQNAVTNQITKIEQRCDKIEDNATDLNDIIVSFKTEIDTNINTLDNKKQNTLVSGTNIKTINGNSILGSGNIEISGSGEGISDAPDVSNSSYDRVNGNWKLNKYYIPGDISHIQGHNLNDVLGDYNTLVQMAQANVTIIAKYTTENSNLKYYYLGTILNYKFNQNDGSFEFGYIIDKKFISFSVSTQNSSWGYISNYKEQDLSKDYLENNAPSDDKIYGRKNRSWVEIPSSEGIPEAPSDGKKYVRQNGKWIAID